MCLLCWPKGSRHMLFVRMVSISPAYSYPSPTYWLQKVLSGQHLTHQWKPWEKKGAFHSKSLTETYNFRAGRKERASSPLTPSPNWNPLCDITAGPMFLAWESKSWAFILVLPPIRNVTLGKVFNSWKGWFQFIRDASKIWATKTCLFVTASRCLLVRSLMGGIQVTRARRFQKTTLCILNSALLPNLLYKLSMLHSANLEAESREHTPG